MFMATSAISQNLVENGDFEQFDHVEFFDGLMAEQDTHYVGHDLLEKGMFYRVYGWSLPSATTPDFVHGDPCNGLGCMGLIGAMSDDYREFIQMKLVSPLIKDSTYTIRFNICTSEKQDYRESSFAPTEIGFLFDTLQRNTSSIKYPSLGLSRYNQPTRVDVPELGDQWTQVEFLYEAKGLEQFITIGVIKPVNEMPEFFEGDNFSYYLVDDFYVGFPTYEAVLEIDSTSK